MMKKCKINKCTILWTYKINLKEKGTSVSVHC